MRTWPIVACLVGLGCSSPDLTGLNFACEQDSDCPEGSVCAPLDGELACQSADTSTISVGLSAPFQGPSQDLGIEMRRGILANFQRVNAEGGVFGRHLALNSLNDNYDPELARENLLTLLDVERQVDDPDQPDERGDDGVFALLGNVGTPTMLVTAPLATKNETVFFAPFTGSQRYLRDGTNSPYVFNMRAGYYDETEAIVDYMASYRSPRIITGEGSHERLLVFAQDDSYGDAGYDGFVGAYDRKIAPLAQLDGRAEDASIRRVGYLREDLASVDDAIREAEEFLSGLLTADGLQPNELTDEESTAEQAQVPVGILMVDTYLPGAKFIRAIKDWINQDVTRARTLDVTFIHLSFVGSDALASSLTDPPATYTDVTDSSGDTRASYAQGVMVTQVVPYYRSEAAGVARYREDIANFDAGEYSFTSLEGYLSAELFVEALKRNGRQVTTSEFVHTLDHQMSNVDLGIGTLLSFSPVRRQACQTVWGSEIQADGSFTMPFSWSRDAGVIPGASR